MVRVWTVIVGLGLATGALWFMLSKQEPLAAADPKPTQADIDKLKKMLADKDKLLDAKDKQLDQFKVSVAKLEKQLADEKKRDKTDDTALRKELELRQQEILKLQGQLKLKDQELGKLQAATAVALKELEQRRTEATKLQDLVRVRERDLDKLQTDHAKLKQELIQAALARESYLERLQRLEAEYRQLVKDPPERLAFNPPPVNIEGIVKEVAGNSGLVSISLGSDDGLVKGHTLEVFRLEPQPEYLGTITIIAVDPKQAVGKPVKTLKPIKPNDRVASRILNADATKDSAPYVHAVIFYLKKDAPKGEVDALIADTHKQLAKIKTVRGIWVGKPAEKATPMYAIKDFQLGLLVLFDDYDGLQKYLDDPLHTEFLKKHGDYWDKVPVYDFVNQK